MFCTFVTRSSKIRNVSLSAIAANPIQSARGVCYAAGSIKDVCVFDYYSYPILLSCTYIMLYLFINVTKSDF